MFSPKGKNFHTAYANTIITAAIIAERKHSELRAKMFDFLPSFFAFKMIDPFIFNIDTVILSQSEIIFK